MRRNYGGICFVNFKDPRLRWVCITICFLIRSFFIALPSLLSFIMGHHITESHISINHISSGVRLSRCGNLIYSIFFFFWRGSSYKNNLLLFLFKFSACSLLILGKWISWRLFFSSFFVGGFFFSFQRNFLFEIFYFISFHFPFPAFYMSS